MVIIDKTMRVDDMDGHKMQASDKRMAEHMANELDRADLHKERKADDDGADVNDGDQMIEDNRGMADVDCGRRRAWPAGQEEQDREC